MVIQLGHRFVMVALQSGFLDGPVHALNLTVGPGMRGLGKAMLNTMLLANVVKNMAIGPRLMGHVTKLDTIVSQHLMDFIRKVIPHLS